MVTSDQAETVTVCLCCSSKLSAVFFPYVYHLLHIMQEMNKEAEAKLQQWLEVENEAIADLMRAGK